MSNISKITYEGQTYEVFKEDVKSAEDAIAFLAPFSPRVAGGDVEVEVKEGMTFYHVTARAEGKGGVLDRIVKALEEASPFIHPAIWMAKELDEMNSAQMLLERGRIRAAFEAGKQEMALMGKIQERLREADPRPGRTVPTGF